MRKVKYENNKCGEYEVMTAQEGHFSKKCDYLILFSKNEYGEYIPVQEINGKVLLAPTKANTCTSSRNGSEWITYGFQVVAGGLRLHLCNPETHETDVAYLLEPATYYFAQCTRHRFNVLFLNFCYYKTRSEIHYEALIKRCHNGHLGNAAENADEIYIDITESRDDIIREFLFEDIVPHGKEKWSPKRGSITEKTDF